MMRRPLLILLAAGFICAGAGIALVLDPVGAASFGWTAYAPLSRATSVPVDLTWLVWRPRVGAALVAIGAGSTGAALAALVLGARAGRGTASR